jgi:tetratricopeptide (TPR) repeat protein
VALWRSLPLPRRVAAIVVFVLLAAVGFLPLFGGLGYEICVASGVVLPSAAAIATAIELSATRDVAPLTCVARGIGTGLMLAAIAFVTAVLHGLRAGTCDFWGGALLFALTAGFGAPLGGLWGAVVAETCRDRKRRRLACVLLALAGPVGGVAISVARFYGSPMVFGYDPFFGYFSGALYDTVVDVRAELWTYRAGTLATLAGGALLASALLRTTDGKLALRPLRGNPPAIVRLALGVAAMLTSVALCAEGPRLGHWQTADSIASALGGRAQGARCDVVYPDSLLADQVALLVRDCDEELVADEQRLGAHLDGRLTAFLFHDADEKRRLMGAADTSIAKPWRREVYVQMSGFPHPILGHEVAHVVSGSFGHGPFRIAGSLGGLLPNPGLIEGTAVATSPDDDELTDEQWARAMLDLGILPSIRELFSLGFLGENASKSYTVAGAFVTWVLDRWGTGVLRAWYGGGSIEELTGQPWASLEEQFHAVLRALAMPPEATTYARAKFERPSVWARHCPHVVDALDRRADHCRDEHRYARAVSLYDAALERDPHDWHARLDRARVDMGHTDEARGRADLAGLVADEGTPRTWRDRAEEALADDDLARGKDARAAESYRALAARTLDEDVARTLEVKALSVDNPPARRAIVDLLIGEPGRPVDTWLGALAIGQWAEETHEPLAGYLVGKNLALHDQYARAATWLDRALDAGLPSARIGRELLRQRAICACALDDHEALARVRRAVDAPASPFADSSGGRRDWVLRLIARCGGS